MWLIRTALRRPITVLMLVLGAGATSLLALQRMRADILPDLGTPVLYVAQAYGGMDPAQMEGYLVNYYEFHFLYINGIDRVESKSIQDVGLVTLHFHPGTDMAQALAEADMTFRAGQLAKTTYDLRAFDPELRVDNIMDFYRQALAARQFQGARRLVPAVFAS